MAANVKRHQRNNVVGVEAGHNRRVMLPGGDARGRTGAALAPRVRR